MQFSNLNGFCRRFVGKVQTAESVRVSVKNDIADVLSVGVDSAVNSYEATAGEASFFGKTNVRLVYSDGTTVCGQSYSADFTASISSDVLDADSKLTFDVATVETKTDVNANTATLTILLEVTVFAYVAQGTTYLAGSDEAFCLTEGVEYLQHAEVHRLGMSVEEELTASRSITTVLLAESCLAATEYTLSEGVLHIVGDACVRLTYISDGTIVTDALPFRFERELDAAGMEDCQLCIGLAPRNTKVRLNITEAEVNTAFTAEIVADVRVEATRVERCDVVCDAYGTDRDYLPERKSFTTTLPCGSTVERKRVVATLPLAGGRTPIAAINACAIVTKCTSLERRAEVQGVVQATVLYSTDAGTVGEPLELPFCETVAVDYLMPICESTARVAVFGLAVRDVGGMQAEAELCFTVESRRTCTFSVIVSAEEQPFDKSALPAIEVCLAHKGETLWQLCKSLHLSEEDLLATNPEITNPLEADARIVVFNRI